MLLLVCSTMHCLFFCVFLTVFLVIKLNYLTYAYVNNVSIQGYLSFQISLELKVILLRLLDSSYNNMSHEHYFQWY